MHIDVAIAGLVTMQLVKCCVVVPPAKNNLFPAIPVCLSLWTPRDARSQTVATPVKW